jgi:hypothetical protein
MQEASMHNGEIGPGRHHARKFSGEFLLVMRSIECPKKVSTTKFFFIKKNSLSLKKIDTAIS